MLGQLGSLLRHFTVSVIARLSIENAPFRLVGAFHHVPAFLFEVQPKQHQAVTPCAWCQVIATFYDLQICGDWYESNPSLVLGIKQSSWEELSNVQVTEDLFGKALNHFQAPTRPVVRGLAGSNASSTCWTSPGEPEREMGRPHAMSWGTYMWWALKWSLMCFSGSEGYQKQHRVRQHQQYCFPVCDLPMANGMILFQWSFSGPWVTPISKIPLQIGQCLEEKRNGRLLE